MNMNPDEAKLALWLDDELEGDELAAFEARQVTPERLAARDEVRKWRQTLSSALPVVEEPPYGDFFNSRIQRSIREIGAREPVAAREPSRTPWFAWFFPALAAAGMAFTFWLGKTSASGPVSLADAGPTAEEVAASRVYTPDGDVDAEWFASAPASATVIVLEGVGAIPDSTDFSASAYVPANRESGSTTDGREWTSGPVIQ
jgi:hypothetical protein